MAATKDITRLPKWAQERIDLLERSVEHYKAKLEEGPANSNTFADPYSDARRPLGQDARVRWVLEQRTFPSREGTHDSQYIEAHLVEGRLRVTTSDGMRLGPESSNSLYIELTNHRGVRLVPETVGEKMLRFRDETRAEVEAEIERDAR